jgi:hypothetical protein
MTPPSGESALASLGREEIRARAGEILAQSEYARWRSAAEWGERIDQALRELFDWLAELNANAPALYWLIVAALFAVALLLFAHVAWTIRAALRRSAPTDAGPLRPPAPSLVAEARELALSGRHLEAARRVQLAAIELLLRRGAIDLGRSDANRVLRRNLTAGVVSAGQRAEFVALLDRLERAWFRDRADDPDLYARWSDLYARLAAEGGAP